MMIENNDLSLRTLDADGRSRTVGYWYLITSHGVSHTAFNSRTALLNWLEVLGLTLSETLTAEGSCSTQSIGGGYCTKTHMNYLPFYALKGAEIRTLSNGDYTKGIITFENGIATLHTLNPNCKDRDVYDYFESRETWG